MKGSFRVLRDRAEKQAIAFIKAYCEYRGRGSDQKVVLGGWQRQVPGAVDVALSSVCWIMAALKTRDH
ncbi:hypothetical protein UB47_12795 [Pseudomonas sp. 5]|nr:hypothetical protein UB47_12795 [Pseudomonas sp. 5]